MYQSDGKTEADDYQPGSQQDNIYSRSAASSDSKPWFKEGYWSDEHGNKITRLNPKDRAYAHVKTSGILPGEKVQIYVYDWDISLDPDDYVFSMFGFVDDNGHVFAQIDEEIDLYDPTEDISELYFQVRYYPGEADVYLESTYPSKTEDYLKCMIIGEIPEMMGEKNWPMGKRYMDYWFDGDANSDSGQKPIYGPSHGMATMDWLLSWPRAKEAYDKVVSNSDLWTNYKATESIRNQIRQMNKDGWLQWPEFNKTVPFGTTSRGNGKHEEDGNLMPRFHKYYFNYSQYLQPTGAGVELDDFYASYGNFSFALTPHGTITRVGHNKILIRLERIGIHTWDSFDFEQGKYYIDQYLGHWSFLERDVHTQWYGLFGSGSYHYIENEDFRAWRDVYGKGGDFTIYSDIKMESIRPIEFEMYIN